MSHGDDSVYGWPSALLPGLNAVSSGGSGDLELTPEGTSAFPGVTNADINAGPWHSHFAGNFGGLQVLARSTQVQDAAGNPAAVIIGGAGVRLPGAIVLSPVDATNPTGTDHTVTATVRNNQGELLPGAAVTFRVVSGPNAGVTGQATSDASGEAPVHLPRERRTGHRRHRGQLHRRKRPAAKRHGEEDVGRLGGCQREEAPDRADRG